jgi:hypothetical protein
MRDRKTEVTIEQIERIRQLSREGYSANQIQRKLQQQHIGSKRTTLSEHVRESKRQQAEPPAEVYVPTRYQTRKPKQRTRTVGLVRQVTLVGTHRGKVVAKRVRGPGSQLYRFVVEEMESDFWDAKPKVFS